MFERSGVEFNTLSVVNRPLRGPRREIYRFFRDTVHSKYMQFLPAVEHVVDKPGFHRPLIVSPRPRGARLAEVVRHGRRLRAFSVRCFRPVGRGRRGPLLRADVRRLAGPVVRRAAGRLLDGRDVRRRAGRRTQRRRLFLRPLRLPRIQTGQYPRNPACRRSTARASGWISVLPSATRCPPSACGANITSPAGASARSTALRRGPTAAAKFALRRFVQLFPPCGALYGLHARPVVEAAGSGVGRALSPASAWG